MRRALVVVFIVLGLAPAAEAHQNPAGCNENAAVLNLTSDRPIARNGETINYTVSVSNLGAFACDIDDAKAVLHLPGRDGLPVAAETVLAEHAPLLNPTPLTPLPSVPYRLDVDPGVTTVVASVSGTGVLHDASPDHSASIAKTLGTSVNAPRLNLTLSAAPATGTVPFSTKFTYILINQSLPATPVKGITITHPACTGITRVSGDTDGDQALDPAETWRYECTRAFTTPLEVTSTAAANGTSESDNGGIGTVSNAVTVKANAPVPVSNPRLTLTKTPNPPSGLAPLLVTYVYEVRNESTTPTPINNVRVEDANCDPVVSDESGPLAVGATRKFACQRTFAAGRFSGTAIAKGEDGLTNLTVVSDPVDATVTATAPTPPPVIVNPPTPRPTTPQSTRVTFRVSGRFARPCSGRVKLTFLNGKKVLARKTVRPNRACRYRASVTITRSKLGNATRLTVRAKLGRRTNTTRVTVPQLSVAS